MPLAANDPRVPCLRAASTMPRRNASTAASGSWTWSPSSCTSLLRARWRDPQIRRVAIAKSEGRGSEMGGRGGGGGREGKEREEGRKRR
eukprot:354762-Chlamydomonas_euryale.AAC.10